MSNRTKDMSRDSTQNIPQEATKLKKLAKATARYMEMEQFKDSDHHTGYFCYNCIYFMKPNHCAIVTDEGADVYDKTSGEIAPHGICALWEPNQKEMRQRRCYRYAQKTYCIIEALYPEKISKILRKEEGVTENP